MTSCGVAASHRTGRNAVVGIGCAIVIFLTVVACHQESTDGSTAATGTGEFLTVDQDRLGPAFVVADSSFRDFGSFYVTTTRLRIGGVSVLLTVESYGEWSEDLMDSDTTQVIRGSPATVSDEFPFVFWVERASGSPDGGVDGFVTFTGTESMSQEERLALAESIPLIWTDGPEVNTSG